MHEPIKTTLPGQALAFPSTAELPKATGTYEFQGVESKALRALVAAHTLLSGQEWKSMASYQKLMDKLATNEGPLREGALAQRLIGIISALEALPINELKVEFKRIVEETFIRSTAVLDLGRADKRAFSREELAATETLIAGELEIGNLAQFFGGNKVFEKFTTAAVNALRPLLQKNLGELALRQSVDHITPQMVFYCTVVTMLHEKIMSAVSSQVPSAEVPQGAAYMTVSGVVVAIAGIITSSIELGLFVDLQDGQIDGLEVARKLGTIVRGRALNPRFLSQDGNPELLATLVTQRSRIASMPAIYRDTLAIAQHGRQAVAACIDAAMTLPDTQDQQLLIFPMSRTAILVRSGAELIPIMATYDGVVGQLEISPIGLDIKDRSGIEVRSNGVEGTFIPGRSSIYYTSNGSFVCGSATCGIYTTLPTWQADQAVSLNKLVNFYQRHLMDIWGRFPELIDAAGKEGFFWGIDLESGLFLLVTEEQRTAHSDTLAKLGAEPVDGVPAGYLGFRFPQTTSDEVETADGPHVDESQELPHFNKLADVIRVLHRLGVRSVGAAGSHTGLEYAGRKYTLCSSSRGGADAHVNRLAVQILRYLKISHSDFLSEWDRS